MADVARICQQEVESDLLADRRDLIGVVAADTFQGGIGNLAVAAFGEECFGVVVAVGVCSDGRHGEWVADGVASVDPASHRTPFDLASAALGPVCFYLPTTWAGALADC